LRRESERGGEGEHPNQVFFHPDLLPISSIPLMF
jgi:hypothetical protein